jgi:hypothetical protein
MYLREEVLQWQPARQRHTSYRVDMIDVALIRLQGLEVGKGILETFEFYNDMLVFLRSSSGRPQGFHDFGTKVWRFVISRFEEGALSLAYGADEVTHAEAKGWRHHIDGYLNFVSRPIYSIQDTGEPQQFASAAFT